MYKINTYTKEHFGGTALLKLKGYVYSLVIMLLLLFGVNVLLILTNVCEFTIWYALYTILLGTLLLIIIDGVIAFLVSRIPQKWLNPYFWGYKIFKFERRFYEFLGVRKWKDKIPELGGALKNFSKSKIEEHTPQYVYNFITETISGEILHNYAIVFGALIFFALPKYILNFALPLFLINAVLNILPAIVQRYTRPKLLKMYNRMLLQEEEMLYNKSTT